VKNFQADGQVRKMGRSVKRRKRTTSSAKKQEAVQTPRKTEIAREPRDSSGLSMALRRLAKRTSPITHPVQMVILSILRRPMIMAWLGMLIFALHACTHMVAAGDTWVAMACGRHFINHGVDTVEPFSANSHKPGPTPEEVERWPDWAQWITDKVGLDTVKKWHPTGWINQNWLTHVIFYWLSTTLGSEENPHYNALVYWKFAIYILAVISVYYTGRLLGAHPALSAVFACFAMFIGRSFFDVRPAGFSNLLVAVFLFILVLTSYRNVLYIWLIVPLSVFWCNVHGGYIYAFITLVPFVALNLLTSISKKRFLSIGRKGIYHTVAAGIVAFFAVILFNPFHLTNLTHTFIISVSKHAERWRDIHEWHPAFEWDNPVGTAVPFLIMYIMAWCLLLSWAVVLIRTLRYVSQNRRRKAAGPDEYELPKVDLSLMVIAALTVYMAIRSRRFIPIAAIAACPVLAMLIHQIVCAVSATRNLRTKNRLVVSPIPNDIQLSFAVIGAAAVLFFGTWWGLKFKHIYLDAWPSDTQFNSIFMRMTASDAKPFHACKFIKANKLRGKMFNYWTEGGFIAYGQEPDPKTGRTPLQLFMDGRAQAAYDRSAFDLWTRIMSGGQITAQILASTKARGQNVTSADYAKIANWIDEQLKAHDVWVVLMPSAVFNDPRKNSYYFVKALEQDPDWPLVFVNNKQKLFVDITTPQGRELFENMGRKTVYPEDCSKNLALARKMLLAAAQLESTTQQIARAQKTLKSKHDDEDALIKAERKGLTQIKDNLAQLSEQLKTLQQRLPDVAQQAGPELEELTKQKRQIEKAIETTEAKLAAENSAIQAREEAAAQSKVQLAELSAQLRTVQGQAMVAKKQGFDFAAKALSLNPSPAPVLEIVLVAAPRFPELRPRINNLCKNYFDDFEKNKDVYTKQHGYRLRLAAARITCIQLQNTARATRNTKLVQFYAAKIDEYDRERQWISREKRW